MASERLTKAESRLNAYYEAEMAVLSSQAYTIGGRTLTRADLAQIKQSIKELENLVEELKSVEAGTGRRKAYRITPRDL